MGPPTCAEHAPSSCGHLLCAPLPLLLDALLLSNKLFELAETCPLSTSPAPALHAATPQVTGISKKGTLFFKCNTQITEAISRVGGAGVRAAGQLGVRPPSQGAAELPASQGVWEGEQRWSVPLARRARSEEGCGRAAAGGQRPFGREIRRPKGRGRVHAQCPAPARQAMPSFPRSRLRRVSLLLPCASIVWVRVLACWVWNSRCCPPPETHAGLPGPFPSFSFPPLFPSPPWESTRCQVEVYNKDLWTAGEYVHNHFVEGLDKCCFLAPDRINAAQVWVGGWVWGGGS